MEIRTDEEAIAWLGLVMNGDDDVIETARPWLGPSTWEDVQHMYWRRSGKLPPTG